MGQHYKEIASIALKRREAAIPREYLLPEQSLANLPRNLTTVPKTSGHFTPEELEIIETNAEDILVKVKEKIWTSLVVTKAFCKAAAVAQQLVCCSNLPSQCRTNTSSDKLPDRGPLPRSPRPSQVPR